MWEVEFQATGGQLGPELAAQVQELLMTDDPDRADDLMVLIEAAVAPVSGGLSVDVVAVLTCVVAGLPWMRTETRPGALLLLTQIAGSAELDDKAAAASARSVLAAALPLFGKIAEIGSDDEVAQSIDLISMCSSLSEESTRRAVYFLERIVADAEGATKASAQLELDEIMRGSRSGGQSG